MRETLAFTRRCDDVTIRTGPGLRRVTPPPSRASPDCVSNGEGRLVLVVDDEPVVLNSVAAVLEFAGYRVMRASSAEEAIRIATQQPTSIDLLLTDVRLPGASGPVLARRFSILHPEAHCLFMAGLPNHPDLPENVRHDRDALLAKPFTPRVLLEAVEKALQLATHP